MFDPDYWRSLPSGRGQMAILKMTGVVVLREAGRNNLYMQGSKDIYLAPQDIGFMYIEYEKWLAAGNSPATGWSPR